MLQEVQLQQFDQLKRDDNQQFPNETTNDIKQTFKKQLCLIAQSTHEKISNCNHNDLKSKNLQIHRIFQDFVQQNNRLSEQRQALFKKNCQLVNEIKYIRGKYMELATQKNLGDKLSLELKSISPYMISQIDDQQSYDQQQNYKNKLNTNKFNILSNQRPRIRKSFKKMNKYEDNVFHQQSYDLSCLDRTTASPYHFSGNQKGIICINQDLNLLKLRRNNRYQKSSKKNCLFSDRSDKVGNLSPKKSKHLQKNMPIFSKRVKTEYINDKKLDNYINQTTIQEGKTQLNFKRVQNKSFLLNQTQEQTTDEIKGKLNYPMKVNCTENIKIRRKTPEIIGSKKEYLYPKIAINNNIIQQTQQSLNNRQGSKHNNQKFLHRSNIGEIKPKVRQKSNHGSNYLKQLEQKIQKIRGQNQRLRNN